MINVFSETTRGISPPFGLPKGGERFWENPKRPSGNSNFGRETPSVNFNFGRKTLVTLFLQDTNTFSMFLKPVFAGWYHYTMLQMYLFEYSIYSTKVIARKLSNINLQYTTTLVYHALGILTPF